MIIFTEHSLLKLKQRKIRKDLITETLNKADFKFLSYGNRKIAHKKFSKSYLKVIYKEENKNLIVITAYWDKQFKP